MSHSYEYVCLVSSYNRVEKTAHALQAISAALSRIRCDYLIILVDASSSDGTPQAVVEFENVKLLSVPETFFWARAMNAGFSDLEKNKIEYESLIVFNDDVLFDELELYKFLQFSSDKNVAVAPVCDSRGKLTYGGLRRASKLNYLSFEHTETPVLTTCDTLNMNIAVIKKCVINECGFLSDYFDHGGADYEFGLKVRAKGFQIIQYNAFVGVCNRNSEKDEILLSNNYVLKTMLSKKYFPFIVRYKYYKNHGGPLWFIFLFTPYVRAIFHDLKVFLR